MSGVGALRSLCGTGSAPCAAMSSLAFCHARVLAFDLGALARKMHAWARAYIPSGIPTRRSVASADAARVSARGSALPTSSLAKMSIRRDTKSGSSPASSMRIIQ